MMPQEITVGCKALCEQAAGEVETISTEDAIRSHAERGATLIDVRDVRELERDGAVPGAFHAPRGMLEFWIDPNSPYHKDVFAGDGPFMFMCASGMRSLLATRTAQDMGLRPVMNLEGGFGAWKKAGGPVERK